MHFSASLEEPNSRVKYYIFARADNFIGKLVLRMKGYKPHDTLFGKVMKKTILRG